MSVRPVVLLLSGWCAFAADPFPQFKNIGDDFRVVINADPHVSGEQPGQVRPFNRIAREFVAEVNALNPQPAFVIFDGDEYERNAYPASVESLERILKDLKPLPVLVTGNHDVRDSDVDRIFRPVQKKLNGTTEDTFSFDAGRWHFVVMPTRELVNTRETQDAFLAWLDRDLKANRTRPTLAFQHYHILASSPSFTR